MLKPEEADTQRKVNGLNTAGRVRSQPSLGNIYLSYSFYYNFNISVSFQTQKPCPKKVALVCQMRKQE